MTAFERREQIIDRMKVRKFDTAFSLAQDFNVTERTIRNDVQELMCSGYPIQADMGRGGGIRWTGNKRQFPFTERELLALHNAIAAVSPEDKPVLEKLLRDKTPPEVEMTNNDIFELLRDGMSQAELARELGVSGALISYLLSGKKKISAELAERISIYRDTRSARNEG